MRPCSSPRHPVSQRKTGSNRKRPDPPAGNPLVAGSGPPAPHQRRTGKSSTLSTRSVSQPPNSLRQHRHLVSSTRAGEMAANIIISGSRYERRLISQRTRDALAAKRARGERLGAAPTLPLEVTRRIISERANGRTFQPIADGL